ncbi:cupin domain-containing protein [Methylobacterium sp. J-068]|uniref:cupin domain-containing protein n=1 Tax=Methylobacterium sp. J-068 TaxID=2836649 RepID=UPI001FBB748E|nr:cupin domain-containing protein [Methylobacterium sp. J-068]MCJ2033217.1 cupin domain-containing protein [Methylobacterium sp. J-068]
MKRARLADMVGGWFIGNFEPSVLRTGDFEVGIKRYKAGDVDVAHYHRIATEITVVVSGEVEMLGEPCSAGDILTVEPGEVNQFRAITDAVLAVVKTPSVADDKFQ